MKKITFLLFTSLTFSSLGYYLHATMNENNTVNNNFAIKTLTKTIRPMKLGAFSLSLAVKDLQASKEFYEKLGFTSFGGSMEMNYLIMKNESTLIGLFQGMFQGNIITFNPGWDENAKDMESFDDVRAIQSKLKNEGCEFISEADPNSKGPASFMLTDPDGNVILFDQHRE